MPTGNQQFVLQFTADTTQMQSSLRTFTGNAKTLLGEIQTAASRPIKVNVAAQSALGGVTGGTPGAGRPINPAAAAAALGPQLAALQAETANAAIAGGATRVQGQRLGQQAVSQAATRLAGLYNLTADQQAQLQRAVQQQLLSTATAARATQVSAAARVQESEQLRTSAAREVAVSQDALRAKAQRIVAEQQQAIALRQLTREEARLAGLRGAEARAAIGRAAQAGPAGAVGQTPGEFLRGGARSTLRFAIPSALLFGTARGISSIVKESEELEQINVRLEGQFKNLGNLGTFDGLLGDIGLAVTDLNRVNVAAAQLDTFRDSLVGVSKDTGITSDQIFELGGAFVGFFSSLDGADSDLSGLASEATRIAAEFSVITGLDTETAFNDLTASVRVFAADGADLNSQLTALTDNLVSVSDTSGVAAGELADFVGRIAPIAQTAGFAAEEVAAIGGALLQASGLGGAVLAEQFGRIISTFGDGLDEELADLAIAVPDLDLSLDDIFSGNTRDVLFQLINGFDELSEAQQRQVIASIGSRREGNTLATLLTNQQGVLQGLASQQDNAGAASERFADVAETLTVKFNQLVVQFEKFGLALLQGGLGDILQDFVGLISVLARGLDVLIPVFGGVAKATGLIPPELAALGLALFVANRTLTGFGGALASAGSSLRNLRLGPAINEISANAAAGAAGVGKLAASFRVLNGALGIAAVAFTAFQLVQAARSRTDEEAVSRQARLNDTLREAGNQYVTIADRAAAYNAELTRTLALQGQLAGSSDAGPLDPGGAAAAASAGLGEGINILAEERGLLSEFSTLIRESGLGLNEIAAESVGAADGLGNFLNQAQELRRQLAVGGIDEEGQLAASLGLLDAALGESAPELVQGLRALALESENGFDAVFQTVGVLNTLASDNDSLIRDAAVSVETALSQLAVQSTTDEAVKAEIAALLLQRETLGGVQGDIALIAGAESLIPLSDAEQGALAQAAEAEFSAAVSAGLADLEQVKAQLEAGVSTTGEFISVATDTVVGLREQLDSALGRNPEQAARIIGEINSINELLAKLTIEAFEDAEEILDLLGEDGRSADRLLGLATNVTVRRSPEQFRSLVVELIEKEKEVALEAAGRAKSAEEAAALLNEFEISAEVQALFVETQIRSEASPIILAIASAAGADVEATFALITEQVLAGRSLEEAVRLFVLQEIEKLEALVASGDASSEVLNRLSELRGQFEGIGFEPLPDIVTGDRIGLDPDAVANVVDSLNDQYELVLEGIRRDSEILRAFGIDNRPENLASQAAQLFQILSDPNFTDSEARFEVAVQLAGVLQSIASLQEEELAAAEEAIRLLTNGADIEQLVTAEAVFASISDQTNAFNRYLATYLNVGEETLNALNRNIANFVAGGASAAQALALASQIAITQLETQINTMRQAIGAAEFFGGDASIARQQLAVLEAELESLQAANANASGAPDVTIGGVSVGDVRPVGGSSAAADDAATIAADLAAAQFELLRARFALDPVALARIAQEEAAVALANAKTEADRVRAQAQRINADREFATAVREVFSAQTELAIALAQIAGNTEEALRLGVQQARRELRFLRRQGAGEAAIADAERQLAQAQEAEFEGLIQDQLGDLSFLFRIGELSTQQYIAQLEGILSTLDPIADKDIFRDITLQIQDLRNRTNDLSTNLGDFSVPSLFEVRRLAATGFGGTPDQAGPGGSVDNRTISVTLNISDGVSWEDAVNVINDAIGTNAPVSFHSRNY
jgi:hypothetical protein